jgi:hypothetical protein
VAELLAYWGDVPWGDPFAGTVVMSAVAVVLLVGAFCLRAVAFVFRLIGLSV